MAFFAIGVPATLVVPAMCAVLIYKAMPGHVAEIIPLLLPSLAIAAISLAFSTLPGLGTALDPRVSATALAPPRLHPA